MALHCFGDSYTEGYKNDMQFWPYDAYRKYLGLEDPKDMPPLWSELLGEKLGVESFNYGKGGASNHEIFFNFCEQVDNINDNDIVIINWTYIQRCLWVVDSQDESDTSNLLVSISSHQGEHYDRDGLFKNAFDTIALNRTNFSWTYEVLKYQKIINSISKLKNFKVYYWFTDNHLYHNMAKIEDMSQSKYILNDLQTKYRYNPEDDFGHMACEMFEILREYGAITLAAETNQISGDEMHLGGIGHKVQADIFYCYLTKTPYPKKLEKYL